MVGSCENGLDAIVLISIKGVSGTGKSTLGAAIAKDISMPFIDGDDLHPEVNVDKMASGEPLTDADRQPWLDIIRNKASEMTIEQHVDLSSDHRAGVVVACSALKKIYRDVLRGHIRAKTLPDGPPNSDKLSTYFVFIKGEREALMKRMLKRQGHFMKANMLDSQLQTLESPEDEDGVVVIPMGDTVENQVRLAREGLQNMLVSRIL
jgi:gluconokinase